MQISILVRAIFGRITVLLQFLALWLITICIYGADDPQPHSERQLYCMIVEKIYSKSLKGWRTTAEVRIYADQNYEWRIFHSSTGKNAATYQGKLSNELFASLKPIVRDSKIFKRIDSVPTYERPMDDGKNSTPDPIKDLLNSLQIEHLSEKRASQTILHQEPGPDMGRCITRRHWPAARPRSGGAAGQ
jgi:hypothetical protein